MATRMTVAALVVLLCSIVSGCALGDGQAPRDPTSFQVQELEMGVGGTIGPRHGPYGR